MIYVSSKTFRIFLESKAEAECPVLPIDFRFLDIHKFVKLFLLIMKSQLIHLQAAYLIVQFNNSTYSYIFGEKDTFIELIKRIGLIEGQFVDAY